MRYFGKCFAFVISVLLIGGCALVKSVGENAPKPSRPVIVNKSVTTWPGDSHHYISSIFDLTFETGALDVFTMMEGNTKLSSYKPAPPHDTSGYVLEKETVDSNAGTRQDEYSIYVGNLQNHPNCSDITYTFKTTSLNPNYKGMSESISRTYTFVHAPVISSFNVPASVQAGQSFPVSFSARAKKAEIDVQYPGSSAGQHKVFMNTGCGGTLNGADSIALNGRADVILKVWNEADDVKTERRTVNVKVTSGTETYCLQKAGNIAGMYQLQVGDPFHNGSCKAIITNVTAPSPNMLVKDSNGNSAQFCNVPSRNDMGMTHTDSNNQYQTIDHVTCAQSVGAFDGQTVAGTYTTNFSVFGETPPATVCLQVQWTLPQGCQ